MYLIHNKPNDTYFVSQNHEIKHYSPDIREAKKFKDKREADKVMLQFNHIDNFELIKEVGKRGRKRIQRV